MRLKKKLQIVIEENEILNAEILSLKEAETQESSVPRISYVGAVLANKKQQVM